MPFQNIRYIEVKGFTQPREVGLGTWSFVVINSRGEECHQNSGYIGENITALQAEYYSLLAALKFMLANNYQKVSIHTSHEQLVKQVRGEWNVKAALQSLNDQVCILLQQTDSWLELVSASTRASSAAVYAKQAYYQARGNYLAS